MANGPNNILSSTSIPSTTVKLGPVSDDMLLRTLQLPPLLGPNQRGILFGSSSKIIVGEKGGVSFGKNPITEEQIKKALFLFENISQSVMNAITTGDEFRDIYDIKEHTDTVIGLTGKITEDPYLKILKLAYDSLQNREPGLWSFANTNAGYTLSDPRFGSYPAFLMRLQNSILLPSRETSFEDISNYRLRRTRELQNLQYHIENLAMETTKSEFTELVQTIQYEKFNKSLSEYNKSISEANFLKRISSIEIKLNWSSLIASAGSYISASQDNFYLGLGLLAGAGISSISLESTFGPKPRTAEALPFEYVFLANEDM